MASFYVTYHMEKIINMSYGGFYKKNFKEMSYEVQRCMVFDWNELGYDTWHSKKCQNEAIFGTLLYFGCRIVLTKGFRVFFE